MARGEKRTSFLNLAKLQHLDVQFFVEFYALYHYLYVPASLTTDPILNTKGSKTSHDILIDTLSRRANLRSLEGSYTGSSSHLQDLRVALYRSIFKVTSQDTKTFIQNDNILTPDDTEETHINLVNFELDSRGYPPLEDQDDIKFVSACIENTYPREYDEILRELTESKEEVISLIRSIEPPPRLPIMKTKYCRYLDRRNLETIQKDLNVAPPCKHQLVRFFAISIYCSQ